MTRATIPLPSSFSECPRAWRNFVESFKQDDKDVETSDLNRGLKPFGGVFKWKNDVYGYSIDFKTEEGYVMFLLRWG